jgi:hypothetical protein
VPPLHVSSPLHGSLSSHSALVVQVPASLAPEPPVPLVPPDPLEPLEPPLPPLPPVEPPLPALDPPVPDPPSLPLKVRCSSEPHAY